MENKIVYLDIKSIDANPNNPRKAFAEDALHRFAETVSANGGGPDWCCRALSR